MQFGIGASGGFVVGWLTDGTGVPMAGLMLAGAVAAKCADMARRPKRPGLCVADT